eukprot:CAMPEP_0183727866 /NCGR_PEP_ID=MMETSP0737-20130205/26591_1 /TAXON_ID=385413 /ORGANISM="Thalassiosira miniscula, Strain CCMP1093" /LENGTH=698 /DNA_ID=CAMNT_0025959617 /DNA_START=9 /DNA_END=2102 /DNA_ORIENTATION=+
MKQLKAAALSILLSSQRSSTTVDAFAFRLKVVNSLLSTSPSASDQTKKTADVAAAAPLLSQPSSYLNDVATTATAASSRKAAATAKQRNFQEFDYNSQWYPVSWAEDVPLNEPIRVTLFDVDYVLAKTTATKTSAANDDGEEEVKEEEEVFYAMLDSCPHKKVALSEGRITDCGTQDKRYFQCSYHGWTFDGESGECMEIPQTMIAKQSKGGNNANAPAATTTKKRREDATSVAVRVVQGMVWMQPSHTPLEALSAIQRGELLPPPTIPEMDLPGYKVTHVVRDFPIDWTVLMENIMDPDHGFFAHSSSETAAKGFDWYSADGIENRVQLDEDFSDGGWKIIGSVNAVEKLLKYNKDIRSNGADNKQQQNQEATTNDIDNDNNADAAPSKLATTAFVAPSLIYMGRRDDSQSSSSFISAFWVCPTGTGKSRFMSATIGKLPFSLPRWLMHINLNNFLDQDTFLLCGQHRAVLKREAEGYLSGEDDDGGSEEGNNIAVTNNNVRKSTYVYKSPSERLPVRLGQFFDATLSRVPNRKEGVLSWYDKHANGGKLLEEWPSREVVLDRYEQHTKVCPDSMGLVKNCDAVKKTSKLVGMAMIFLKMVWKKSQDSVVPTALTNPFVSSGFTLAAVRQLLTQSTYAVGSLANSLGTCLVRGKTFYSILALAYLSNAIASRIKREFFFKFDEELHRKDIKSIAKNW